MNIQDELTLSFYKEISILNQKKNVYLVQHIDTNVIYVKKTMDIYNSNVYQQLKPLKLKGIPEIVECIEDDGKLVIIEEYIHGKNLEDDFNENGCFSEDKVVDIIKQLCPILDCLHRCNPPIIHRDIKPANLVLTADGTLKLIDFNAAKNYSSEAVRDTTLLGTMNFAAPEQYGFSQSDVRTDIYGLGVTMNYLLTGKYPNEEIASGRLHDVLDKCLRIAPNERYSSVEEIIKDMDRGGFKLSFVVTIIEFIVFLVLLIVFIYMLTMSKRSAVIENTTSSESAYDNEVEKEESDSKKTEEMDSQEELLMNIENGELSSLDENTEEEGKEEDATNTNDKNTEEIKVLPTKTPTPAKNKNKESDATATKPATSESATTAPVNNVPANSELNNAAVNNSTEPLDKPATTDNYHPPVEEAEQDNTSTVPEFDKNSLIPPIPLDYSPEDEYIEYYEWEIVPE